MKVSIIIPARNEESLVGNILDGIAGFLPAEIIEEVIVVDDHSTDGGDWLKMEWQG